MGRYVTQTYGGTPAGDITNEIGNVRLGIVCPDGSGGVSSTVADQRIDRAESDVDSLLGPAYTVPFTTIPDAVKYAAIDLAVFYMYERPEFRRQEDGSNPEVSRYKRARDVLKDLKTGSRDSGNETGSKSATVGGVVYASTSHFITDDEETSTGGPTGGF